MENSTNVENEINLLTKQRDDLKREIEEIKKEFLNIASDKPSVKELISSQFQIIETRIGGLLQSLEQIDSINEKLFSPKKFNSSSEYDIVINAIDSIKQNKQKSEDDLKLIETFKQELFGDSSENIEGQKQRIAKAEEEIYRNKKKWEENAAALFNKIEGLLPGATATGLAKAYQEQRVTYSKPYWVWSIIFVLTMFGTIVFAIMHLNDAQSLKDAFMKIISRLPFFIPAFWLALFASKQQSQYKRLQQEYAYKEALTKSYESGKREIEKLPDNEVKDELTAKLLATMIDAAKYNPSETLGSKIHNDNPPSLFDLFKIKAWKKITGVDQQQK
ncbi:MAG: hypothetical protein ACRCYO_19715 [Bacteroidia bacterium]